MSQRMSFCLQSIKTLRQDDLDELTTRIEQYARAGLGEGQAETTAIDDLLAGIAAERKDMTALLRAQHPDLFRGAAPVAAVPAPTPAAPTPAAPGPVAYKVGDYVLTSKAGLDGPIPLRAKVITVLADGKLELRTSEGGIQTVKPADIRPVPSDAPNAPNEAVATPAAPRWKLGDQVVWSERGGPALLTTISKVLPGGGYFVNDPRFEGGSVQGVAVEDELHAPGTVEVTPVAPRPARPNARDELDRKRARATSSLAFMADKARDAGAPNLEQALRGLRVSTGMQGEVGHQPPAYISTIEERFDALLARAKANPDDGFTELRRGLAPRTAAITPEQAAENRRRRLAAAADLSDALGPPTAQEPDAPYNGAVVAREPAPLSPEQVTRVQMALGKFFGAAVDEGVTTFADASRQVLADIEELIGKRAADAVSIHHLQGAYISLIGNYPAGTLDDIMAVAQYRSKDQFNPAREITPDTNPPQEPEDAASRQPRLESDRPAGQEPRVEGPDAGQGQRRADPGDGSIGGQAARPGRGEQGDPGLPGGRPPAGRAGGNTDLFADTPAVQPGPAAGGDAQRSDPADDPGIPPERVPDASVEGAARADTTGVIERLRQQRAAEKIPVTPGDADNIAATLPVLLPLQQKDVAFAEERFAKDDGYGVLFTNGTGTGKTFIGLGIIKRQVRQGRGNILIVVPSAEVMTGWVESAPALGLTVTKLESTKDAGRGVVITTYANLRDNNALLGRKWDMLVSDEAQNLNENADGEHTQAGMRFRALTWHPDSARTRTEMQHPDLFKEIADLEKRLREHEKAKNTVAWNVANAKLAPLWRQAGPLIAANQALVDDMQGTKRPRALFLSATPWAYETNIMWAQGYLFDWDQGHEESGGYNAPNAYQAFMMRHLGYQMRTGKLTQPDERRVDRGLMQRQFNTWLRGQNVLAGRMLEEEWDYDRRFVAAQSALGVRIDQAFSWFSDTKPEMLGELPLPNRAEGDPPYTEAEQLQRVRSAMHNVRRGLQSNFDYHSRLRLLEALKAQAAVPYIREQLDLGRKVVVFHDLIKGQRLDPFNLEFNPATHPTEAAVLARWGQDFADLVTFDWGALKSPIETLTEAFAPNIALLNGEKLGGAIILGLELDGRVRGCGMIFPRLGVDWPFYSYRISYTTQRSSIDGHMVRFPVLTLTNDLEDCAEVGGLMIDPELRKGGYGRVMARSRYVFIGCHRARFGRRLIADLRGWLDDGDSPFWDAVGGRFYAMSFAEADHINGTTGNQFIADLGPRAPIYVNMLSEQAQAAIGKVHDDGHAARNLLVEEGFRDEGYVDIFDAGPTMVGAIDDLRAIRDLRHAMFARSDGSDSLRDHLITCGTGEQFACTIGSIEAAGGQAMTDPASAGILGLTSGQVFSYLAL